MATELEKPKAKPKSNLSFVHGEYVKIGDDSDAYVAFLKDVESNETQMKIADNPTVNIWVTKPAYRVHTHKKEWAPKSELDEYTTRYLYRAECIWNALNNNGPGARYRHMNYVNLRKEMSSPYVYGADVDIGARMKMRYQKINGDRKPLNYTVGHLDIETDVNNGHEIILITFMNHDGNTYTGVLKQFLKNHSLSEIEKMFWEKVEPKFHAELNKKAKKAYEDSDKIKLHLKEFDEEVELIRWVFDNIHLCRPDFVTIWNMSFDIPYILERLKFRGIDPASIFCSNDVPKKYHICNFHLDSSGEHITDNWSWLHCTDYTRYIDAMCMYGRLRKAKGREPSYQLNAICGKEIGTGKLNVDLADGGTSQKFHTTMDHHIAQRDFPVEYSVYNIIDVALMRVLELKNNDVRTMMMLIGDSCLEDFAKQSAQLKNMFYVYLEPLGGVPCSVGGSLEVPWDKYQTNKGGQVLSPDLTKGTGVSILIESLIESFVHKLVCDIDVSAMYPSLMSMLNCTRETNMATILYIMSAKNGKPLSKPVPVTVEQIDSIPEIAEALKIYNDESIKKDRRIEAMRFISTRVQNFLYQAIYIESNAVPLCSEFLGLPDFEEMDKLVAEQIAAEAA